MAGIGVDLAGTVPPSAVETAQLDSLRNRSKTW